MVDFEFWLNSSLVKRPSTESLREHRCDQGATTGRTVSKKRDKYPLYPKERVARGMRNGDVRFSDSRITNKDNLLRFGRLDLFLLRRFVRPRMRTLNKKSKELLMSPMAAVVEGKYAVAVPLPPGPTR